MFTAVEEVLVGHEYCGVLNRGIEEYGRNVVHPATQYQIMNKNRSCLDGAAPNQTWWEHTKIQFVRIPCLEMWDLCPCKFSMCSPQVALTYSYIVHCSINNIVPFK
jgi:hypothetical protein